MGRVRAWVPLPGQCTVCIYACAQCHSSSVSLGQSFGVVCILQCVFWSRARVHVRQKSLTKALVSLWLARLSHWLHSHNGHWLTLHWIEAITSSAVQLSNKGGQKLEKNGKSKIVPGKFQIHVYRLSLRHWWWFSSPLQSKAQLYATITNSVSSGSLISQNLSELS